MIDGVDFSGNGRGGDELFGSQEFGNANSIIDHDTNSSNQAGGDRSNAISY
jgi:hypothetical protein